MKLPPGTVQHLFELALEVTHSNLVLDAERWSVSAVSRKQIGEINLRLSHFQGSGFEFLHIGMAGNN